MLGVNLRAVLRQPNGETVTRDVVDGRWAEPAGRPETTLGTDLWALPGLVDAHAHLAVAELDPKPGVFEDALVRTREALAAGVTLILDKGWCDDVVIRVIDALEPSERPEIEAAARIIANPGGYFDDFALEVDPADVATTVAREAEAGRGWVKLIGDWPRPGMGPLPNFTEEDMRRAVVAAGSVGARVAIHTMAPDVPSQAVAAGIHSIEHGLFITEEDISALGARGGMWVPTLLRSEATMAQLGAGSRGGRLFAEGLSRIRPLLPMAAEAGVHVLAGTDLVGAPADVAAEAIRLSECGLTNQQALDAVSTAGFRATGRDDSFAVGAPADAVWFAANPVDDMRVLSRPTTVLRLGRPS